MEKAYILVIIDGDITGFILVNETLLYRMLKKVYQKVEDAKTLEKLVENQTKYQHLLKKRWWAC